MTTTQAPTTEANDSTGDQVEQETAKGIGSAVGAAALGLGAALAVAVLMPAWLGYTVVALVVVWLVGVSVPYIRKWRSA